MLIEQVIEFELRGNGPPRQTNTPKRDYFYDKIKSLQSYSNYYLLLKILHEAMYLASST